MWRDPHLPFIEARRTATDERAAFARLWHRTTKRPVAAARPDRGLRGNSPPREVSEGELERPRDGASTDAALAFCREARRRHRFIPAKWPPVEAADSRRAREGSVQGVRFLERRPERHQARPTRRRGRLRP